MARFAIEHSFNYYAKRSVKKSYILRCRSEDYVWTFKASSWKVVLPPKYKRQPGRPKKNMHKKSSLTMTSSSNCCGRCGYEGSQQAHLQILSKEGVTNVVY
ncbi:uncharacterized protein LOC107866595 [Capsicum annuum]|uniref:uncharacterized protein LOC107866595 n=1 Tax=Capsicum annuum TaxID=4072 RepID=UPI0007BECEAF|nr:uncharacterized protein LOC107866595 [Capsicum annuum]